VGGRGQGEEVGGRGSGRGQSEEPGGRGGSRGHVGRRGQAGATMRRWWQSRPCPSHGTTAVLATSGGEPQRRTEVVLKLKSRTLRTRSEQASGYSDLYIGHKFISIFESKLLLGIVIYVGP